MSTCPFNKVSGIGCPFYRDRDKGDYCACLQGDCPVEGPEEKVVDTKPIAIQETHPYPSKNYSVKEFFDVHEEEGVSLEEALLNRLWMIWEELDARDKERLNRNCLYSIPWVTLCDSGIEILKYLKTQANYYDRG